MNFKHLLSAATLVALTGCASTDYSDMSSGTGIPAETLDKYCYEVQCHYDQAKRSLFLRGNDHSDLDSYSGGESRTIEYTWTQGDQDITLGVYYVTMAKSWRHVHSAELLVKGETVAEISGKSTQTVGYYNETAGDHEKIEHLVQPISFEAAKKVANASYKDVSIRFHGKTGTIERKLKREHNLKELIELASHKS